MNWTGGGLQRSQRRGDVAAKQKLYFAKARARLISGIKSVRPTRFFDSVPPYLGDRSSKVGVGTEWTLWNSSLSYDGSSSVDGAERPLKRRRNENYSIEKVTSPVMDAGARRRSIAERGLTLGDKPTPARARAEELESISIPTCIQLWKTHTDFMCSEQERLEQYRKDLLARPDWLGLQRLRPLQATLAPRKERSVIRRRLKGLARESRGLNKRRFSPKTTSRRPNAKHPLQETIGPEDVSVRFGTQALLHTQASPEDVESKPLSPRPSRFSSSPAQRSGLSPPSSIPSESRSLWPADEVRSGSKHDSSETMLLTSPLLWRRWKKNHTSVAPTLARRMKDKPTSQEISSQLDEGIARRMTSYRNDARSKGGDIRHEGQRDGEDGNDISERLERSFTPANKRPPDEMLFSSITSSKFAGPVTKSLLRYHSNSTSALKEGKNATTDSSVASDVQISREEVEESSAADEETMRQRSLLAKELREAVKKYATFTNHQSTSPEQDSLLTSDADPKSTTLELPQLSTHALAERTSSRSSVAGDSQSSFILLVSDNDDEALDKCQEPVKTVTKRDYVESKVSELDGATDEASFEDFRNQLKKKHKCSSMAEITVTTADNERDDAVTNSPYSSGELSSPNSSKCEAHRVLKKI